MGSGRMSQEDETERTDWARRSAERIIDGVLTAIERYPAEDRVALLHEIARQAERLRDFFKTEDDLPQPLPFEDELPGG